MSNPLAEFAVYVHDKFGLFVTRIQEEMGIPGQVLLDILDRQDIRDVLTGVAGIRPPTSSFATEEQSLRTAADRAPDGCEAKLKSGDRKGECCGKKISDKSDTGRYCGTHVKLETTGAVRMKQAEEVDGEVFRLNKWGNFAYGETGLILKSETERKIIGKQMIDGKIIDLTPEDVAVCKRRKLKYIERYSEKEPKPEGTKSTNANTIEHTSKIPLY